MDFNTQAVRIEKVNENLKRYEIIKQFPRNGVCTTWSKDEMDIVYSLIWHQKQFTINSGQGPKGFFIIWSTDESVNHYQHCKFEEYCAPKPEYAGYHNGKKFGI